MEDFYRSFPRHDSMWLNTMRRDSSVHASSCGSSEMTLTVQPDLRRKEFCSARRMGSFVIQPFTALLSVVQSSHRNHIQTNRIFHKHSFRNCIFFGFGFSFGFTRLRARCHFHKGMNKHYFMNKNEKMIIKGKRRS